MKVPLRAQVIIDYVKKHKWTRGVELGVLKGDTLFAVLDACPDLHMVGVDLWMQTPEKDARIDEGGWGYTNHDMDAHRRHVFERAKDYGKRVTLYEMPTTEAARWYDDHYFDFAFVDADHLYEAVKADIDAWVPKIRYGGMMLGHDYSPAFPGVMKAVDEVFGRPLKHPDCVWGAPC